MSAQEVEAGTAKLEVLARRMVGRQYVEVLAPVDELIAAVDELQRLRAMRQRAEQYASKPTPWHPADGPKRAWQQAVAEYILGGQS